MGFSQDLKKSKFERARESRGFGIGLEARESQPRARRILAIMCTKNEIKIHHTRAQNEGIGLIQKAQRAQGGWGLLSQSNPIQTLTNPWSNPILKRGTGGERHKGGGLGERTIHGRVTKATQPNTSEGVFIPAETGQTGARDRSDRLVCSIPLYTIPSDG